MVSFKTTDFTYSLWSAPVEILEHEISDTVNFQYYKQTDVHVVSFLNPGFCCGISLAGDDQMLMKQVGKVLGADLLI